ncbi:MAG: NAD(+)/NADH kinase [Lachnospiraceae bacterium]|nr:NAD(+)/NADH kinase [Lachnospiraceae bacterium]
MRNFFIITNKNRDRDLSVTKRTRDYLKSNGCSVYVEEAGPYEDGHYTRKEDVPSDTDCVITIGGDGTLIAAARDTADLDLPILGINQGTLGYLTDIEVDSIETSLDKVLNGDFSVEERMMLCGMIFEADGELIAESRALNDVVIRNTMMKASDYSLSVNSRFLSSFKSDGMIVSTPTGSTAYSMSAGGPIIEPMARMMVITPICPHTLNTRSIVISADTNIEMQVSDDSSSVMFDGHFPCRLKHGDLVRVRPSTHVTRIIKTAQDSFLNVLSKKISS